MYNNITSIQYIESKFPDLSEELRDEIYEGLLHLQIAVFSRLAQRAVDEGDNSLWKEVNSVFLEIWRNCSSDVINALNVSFLEHIHFKDGKKNRSWAYKAMHPIMRKAWDEMEEYNVKIHGG